MPAYIDEYWLGRLERTKKNLEKNGFEAFVAATPEEAKAIALETVLPALKGDAPLSVSFGGSLSVGSIGLYDALKVAPGLEALDTLEYSIAPEEMIARRRRSLTCDLFVTGTNALVEDGLLVNLDGIGNRVAAIAFGPKNVLVVVGRNKLATSLESAMERVKEQAAPINAARLNRKTPCVKTRHCEECSSPERICNVWTITEKSAPKGRIKVILVNADLGF